MTNAREVIARALLIHDEPKARLADQSAAEQERYRTEAKWFERYLKAEGQALVPVEPTEAMLKAAIEVYGNNLGFRRLLIAAIAAAAKEPSHDG